MHCFEVRTTSKLDRKPNKCKMLQIRAQYSKKINPLAAVTVLRSTAQNDSQKPQEEGSRTPFLRVKIKEEGAGILHSSE